MRGAHGLLVSRHYITLALYLFIYLLIISIYMAVSSSYDTVQLTKTSNKKIKTYYVKDDSYTKAIKMGSPNSYSVWRQGNSFWNSFESARKLYINYLGEIWCSCTYLLTRWLSWSVYEISCISLYNYLCNVCSFLATHTKSLNLSTKLFPRSFSSEKCGQSDFRVMER